MTTPTITRPANGSAYPASVAELMPAARLLIDPDTGRLPTRNGLMRELKVGAPKAREVLAALESETAEPTPGAESEPAIEAGPAHPEPVTEPADVPVPSEPAAPVANLESPPIGRHVTELHQATREAVKAKVEQSADPETKVADKPRKPLAVWPVWVLALPAIVAIWSGWVGLGELAGFGMVRPLPGIADGFEFNSAITLPIGMEVYAAFALRVWLSSSVPPAARKFARVSALGSLILGGLGQVAYHLMAASGVTSAPWLIVTAVACLPVAVLGMGAALAHLIKADD